jgi:hypothetical protein
MKQFIFRFVISLIILSGISSSCNPEVEPEENVVKPRPPHPIDIPYENYHLECPYCKWHQGYLYDQLVVLNSEWDFYHQISCMEDNYSEIDFSTHTLLLVKGRRLVGIEDVEIENFKQIAPDQYKLYVKISLNSNKPDNNWERAILIKKLPPESKIELQVTTSGFTVELFNQPLDVVQATVLGKWQGDFYCTDGAKEGYNFDNTFLEITKDRVYITGDFDMYDGQEKQIHSFSYNWEGKHVFFNSTSQTTYVMQINEEYVEGYNGRYSGWVFWRIIEDRLQVRIDFGTNSYPPHDECFYLVRVKD